jgi:hypothetical protein
MIKQSLEVNLDHILAALPEEHHEAFKAHVADAPDSIEIPREDELERIKPEPCYHSHVDERVVGEIDLNSHKPSPPLSEAEQKSAMEQELKRVREFIANAPAEQAPRPIQPIQKRPVFPVVAISTIKNLPE